MVYQVGITNQGRFIGVFSEYPLNIRIIHFYSSVNNWFKLFRNLNMLKLLLETFADREVFIFEYPSLRPRYATDTNGHLMAVIDTANHLKENSFAFIEFPPDS